MTFDEYPTAWRIWITKGDLYTVNFYFQVVEASISDWGLNYRGPIIFKNGAANASDVRTYALELLIHVSIFFANKWA